MNCSKYTYRNYNHLYGNILQLFHFPIPEEISLKLNPQMKYNSYYRSCTDKIKRFLKYPNEFSVDNLFAHFYVEYSGNVVLENGNFVPGLNKKIFFYITNSLNERGAGLRRHLLDYWVKNYNNWKKENNKYKRPRDLVVLFKDIENGKNYYIYVDKLIEYYEKDISLTNFYRSNGSTWYHISREFIEENAYWVVDAPSDTEEDEELARQELKKCCRPVMKEDGTWTTKKVESEPNFDPDKSDMGQYIRTRIQFSKYRRSNVQFIVSLYDKNGVKVDNKDAERIFNSLKEMYEFLVQKTGYNKSYKTFTREYNKLVDTAIEYNGYIIYIQSNESTDIEQYFSNTCLNKVNGKWVLAFLKEFIEKIMRAKNEIVYIVDEYFIKKYISKNFILSLIYSSF